MSVSQNLPRPYPIRSQKSTAGQLSVPDAGKETLGRTRAGIQLELRPILPSLLLFHHIERNRSLPQVTAWSYFLPSSSYVYIHFVPPFLPGAPDQLTLDRVWAPCETECEESQIKNVSQVVRDSIFRSYLPPPCVHDCSFL